MLDLHKNINFLSRHQKYHFGNQTVETGVKQKQILNNFHSFSYKTKPAFILNDYLGD